MVDPALPDPDYEFFIVFGLSKEDLKRVNTDYLLQPIKYYCKYGDRITYFSSLNGALIEIESFIDNSKYSGIVFNIWKRPRQVEFVVAKQAQGKIEDNSIIDFYV